MSSSRESPDPAIPEGVRPDDWQNLVGRRDRHQRWWRRQEPRPVGDVVAQVVQRKGYAQLEQSRVVDEAWREVAGAAWANQARPGGIRRGVLEVLVSNNLLMQEIGFEQQRLLTALQERVPDAQIQQIRFRIG